MTFPRSIGLSLLLHGAILAVAFVQYDPMDSGLDEVPPTSEIFVEYSDWENASAEVRLDGKRDESKHSELVSMDLEAGLDGSSEPSTEPAPRAPREPRTQSDSDEASSAPPNEETESSRESTSEGPTASDDESSRTEPPAESPVPDETTAETSTEPDESSDSQTTDGSEAESSETAESDDSDGDRQLADAGKRGSPEANGREGGTGSGTGASGGSEGTSEEGSEVDRRALIRGYTRKLYRRFAQKKYYPKSARRAGIEGTVRLEVTIDGEGRILAVELHESSGYGVLDRAALEAMRSLDQLPAPPEALAWSEKRLHIPIRYQLDSRG